MNGKKKDYLIEEKKYNDPKTGVDIVSDKTFVVWADAGLKDVILKIEGVVAVYDNQPYPTKYDVFIDARYDIEYIKREVEAEILCK